MHKLILGIIILGLVSCNNKVVYEETKEITNSSWNKNDIKKFTFNVPDTIHMYDIELDFTNSNDYVYSNLFIFSKIIFPNHTYANDTIEFVVADNKGEWTGSGFRSFTNKFLFKKSIKFPIKGTYTFSFEQAMRCTNKECTLDGIEDISLRIIKK